MPSRTVTSKVSTGRYAGSESARPEVMSKRAPWRGHVTTQVAAVEIALAEGAVVVRAAILERVQLTVAVVDTDREEALDGHDPDRPRRQLVERADLDLAHAAG